MLGQFAILLPEIYLASIVLVMQIVAVYFKSCSRQIANFITFFAVILILLLYNSYFPFDNDRIGFDGSFIVSQTTAIFKAIVLALALMSVTIYTNFCIIEKDTIKIEFISLILLSTLGVFITISARDFLLLFCGLELQALAGYALAAFNNHDAKSSEAGLKYFILGALVSCIMLFGISFLYGYSGSINFYEIGIVLNREYHIGLVVGAVLVISAILFKLSAAPMHIWAPDVYEGSPISAVSYFAVAQKFGMLIVLINVIDNVIGDITSISVTIIKIVAILSMIVGALGAIMQHSLKRLMAYSSVLNIGYVLIGISLATPDGKYAAFIYMLIYIISTIGFFACLVALFGKHSDKATFDDLRGIALERKTLAAVITIIMFSFVGVPPLAGFFGKYYLFYNAVKQGEIGLALTGLITSVIAAFYYLKVIKNMYFVDPAHKVRIISTKLGLFLVSGIATSFIILFFIFASSYIL